MQPKPVVRDYVGEATAADIGVSAMTVNEARREAGVSHLTPEREGRDGKQPKEAVRYSLLSSVAANIPPTKVRWLWPGRLAIGKHTCVAGEPGTGKSQLSVAIIAAITTGGEWPCGEGRALLGSVIILSAEDGAADTIVPRLIAAGADLSRVHIVSSVGEVDGKGRRTFSLQTDIELLERKIAEIGDVLLVVVDPVSSYMGKTDSHKNSEVRGVLEPLSDMADRTGTAILTITHFSKAGAGSSTKALHRFIGSIAFTGAPRAAFAVIDDAENEGRKLLLHAKNNLAAPPQGLAFRLEQTIIEDNIVASRVWWESEPVTMTANQAMAADAGGHESRSIKAEAIDFLRDALLAGPRPANEIKTEATAAGITPKPLRDARNALGVSLTKAGMAGGWVWELPKVPITPEDAHYNTWAPSDPLGTFEKPQGGKTSNLTNLIDLTADVGGEPDLEGIPDFLDRRKPLANRRDEPAISAGPHDDLGEFK